MATMKNPRYNGVRGDTTTWGKAMKPGLLFGVQETEYEHLTKHLNLKTDKEIVSSPRMREWIYRHVNKRYVPERILKMMNLRCDFEYAGYVEES